MLYFKDINLPFKIFKTYQIYSMQANYKKLLKFTNKIADIKNAIAVLNWDQETYMPPKGQGFRAQQIATLSGIAHETETSTAYENCINELLEEPSLSPVESKNIQLLKRDMVKAKKLPSDFVIGLSKATSKAFHAWITARKANDFELFKEALSEMVKIQQEKAEIYGYKDHIYNALMDDYEPKATVQEIDTLFSEVKTKLSPLLAQIAKSPQVEDAFMYKHFGKDKQWDFGMTILEQLGYDLEAGRQDLAEHPFSTTFSPFDVRVTTRIKENNLYDMLWSCIHECGHALYEQGLSAAEYGLPCGEAVSLGIHESQSRFYENNIGRSEAFWESNYPGLQATFPNQLGDVSSEDFYRAANIVKPSLIRTDADELSYHFHIMIRYEIEKQLIDGSLAVSDVKEAWNASYSKYLNINVPSDNQGVLQDVHWSHGGFGYFPTYSLGSFYAAQFEAKMVKDIPDMFQEIRTGEFSNILTWLRTNIHQHGRFYTSQELCKNATGETLKFDYFMDYAVKKYSAIYAL